MTDELIDIFDKLDRPTEKTMMKNEAHKTGTIHRAVELWIHRPGYLLMQKRSKNKASSPCCWEMSASGHVAAGEETAIAAAREGEEELGIKIDPKQLKLIGVFYVEGVKTDKEFSYAYALKLDLPIEKFKIQTEEVAEIKWFSIDEAQKMAKDPKSGIIPHGRHIFRYCLNWLSNIREK